MDEGQNHESGGHITIPATLFYLLLLAAGLGGAGGYGVLGPTLETEAIRSCFDNSQTALDVAAQHGEEILDVRNLIYQSTRDRYTGDRAEKDWREQERRDIVQDQRIDWLERQFGDNHR